MPFQHAPLETGHSEFEVLARFFERTGSGGSDLIVGLGDDAAVVAIGEERVALCADALVERVHFDLAYYSIADLAAKAIAVNASDIAAMGATPKFYLSTVASQGGLNVEDLLVGMAEEARAHGALLIGGDLASSGELNVSVTAVGVFEAGAAVLRRGGMVAGDTILVTGPLGGSARGLRGLRQGDPDLPEAAKQAHLRPKAQLAAGALAGRLGAHAAIDVSDGLLADLEHMLVASGVGADLGEIPRFEGATEEEALYGGEDFQLIIASDKPTELAAAFLAEGLPEPIVIGRSKPHAPVRLLQGRPYRPDGYTHLI
ncbi:MAG: thiamine-phosphate kinase [Actinomycetota bacterium]|nr:thiamine-phosphate kinase [Actinomycetota bacterium]